MLGSYHNAETFSYQDEVGQLVLQVCQVKMLFLASERIRQPGVLIFRKKISCTPVTQSAACCSGTRASQMNYTSNFRPYHTEFYCF